MKNVKFLFHVVVALCLVAVVFTLSTFVQSPQTEQSATQTGGGVTLQPPSLFKAAQAAPLAQAACDINLLADAGVTAYTNLAQEIDLSVLENYFTDPIPSTDQYVGGIVLLGGGQKPPQLDEAAIVHALVCADGWIFAYLSSEQPASALIDWMIYEDEGLSTTSIDYVLRLLVEDIGFTLNSGDISYYDFRYPQATNLKLVVDSVDDRRAQEEFALTIPKRLTIFEYSWAHAIVDSRVGNGIDNSTCQRNGANFSQVQPAKEGEWRFAIGAFESPGSIAGATENFSVSLYNFSKGYCGVAIIYKG